MYIKYIHDCYDLSFLPCTSACLCYYGLCALLCRWQHEVLSPALFEAARSGDFSLVTLEEGDNMDVKVSCVCVCVRVHICMFVC